MTFASIVWDVDPVLVHLGSLEIRLVRADVGAGIYSGLRNGLPFV